jgi:hypothetical protein
MGKVNSVWERCRSAKAIQLLPSVQRVTAGSTAFYVRGGGQEYNGYQAKVSNLNGGSLEVFSDSSAHTQFFSLCCCFFVAKAFLMIHNSCPG